MASNQSKGGDINESSASLVRILDTHILFQVISDPELDSLKKQRPRVVMRLPRLMMPRFTMERK